MFCLRSAHSAVREISLRASGKINRFIDYFRHRGLING
jgi:hypothetical protein